MAKATLQADIVTKFNKYTPDVAVARIEWSARRGWDLTPKVVLNLSDIAEFKNIPDVSFIDFLTLEQVQELFRADFIHAYKNATGQTLTLNPADPINLVLLAESNQYYQALQYVDRAGKQDLLKYTYGEYLDNIALRSGLTRKGAGKAIRTLRFTLSATRSSAVAIPAGTRVCTGDNVYFATTEYAEIKPAAFARHDPALRKHRRTRRHRDPGGQRSSHRRRCTVQDYPGRDPGSLRRRYGDAAVHAERSPERGRDHFPPGTKYMPTWRSGPISSPL